VSEIYTKKQIEAALFDLGFTILQETGGFTIYQTNLYPGDDIVLDWSRGSFEWEDLRKQLEYHDIDPSPIHEYLNIH